MTNNKVSFTCVLVRSYTPIEFLLCIVCKKKQANKIDLAFVEFNC